MVETNLLKSVRTCNCTTESYSIPKGVFIQKSSHRRGFRSIQIIILSNYIDGIHSFLFTPNKATNKQTKMIMMIRRGVKRLRRRIAWIFEQASKQKKTGGESGSAEAAL
jgi:hypothetical protein